MSRAVRKRVRVRARFPLDAEDFEGALHSATEWRNDHADLFRIYRVTLAAALKGRYRHGSPAWRRRVAAVQKAVLQSLWQIWARKGRRVRR